MLFKKKQQDKFISVEGKEVYDIAEEISAIEDEALLRQNIDRLDQFTQTEVLEYLSEAHIAMIFNSWDNDKVKSMMNAVSEDKKLEVLRNLSYSKIIDLFGKITKEEFAEIISIRFTRDSDNYLESIQGFITSLPEDNSEEIINTLPIESVFDAYNNFNLEKKKEFLKKVPIKLKKELIESENLEVQLEIFPILNTKETIFLISDWETSRLTNILSKVKPELKMRLVYELKPETIANIIDEWDLWERGKILQECKDKLGEIIKHIKPQKLALIIEQTWENWQILDFLENIEPPMLGALFKQWTMDKQVHYLHDISFDAGLSLFEEISSSEAGNLLSKVDIRTTIKYLDKLSPRKNLRILSGFDGDTQFKYLEKMTPAAAAKVLEVMNPKLADSLIKRWIPAKRKFILREMKSSKGKEYMDSLPAEDRKALLSDYEYKLDPSAIEDMFSGKDLAAIIEELEGFSVSKRADIFANLPIEKQMEIFLSMEVSKQKALLDNMHPKAIALLLGQLDAEKQDEIISRMSYSQLSEILVNIKDDQLLNSIFSRWDVDRLTSYLRSISIERTSKLLDRLDNELFVLLFDKFPESLLEKFIPKLSKEKIVFLLGNNQREDRLFYLKYIGIEGFSKIFSELEPEQREEMVTQFDMENLVEFFTKIEIETALDLISLLPNLKISEILVRLPAKKVEELLQHKSPEEREQFLAYVPPNTYEEMLRNFSPQFSIEFLCKDDDNKVFEFFKNMHFKKIAEIITHFPVERQIKILAMFRTGFRARIIGEVPEDKVLEIIKSYNISNIISLSKYWKINFLTGIILRLGPEIQKQVIESLTPYITGKVFDKLDNQLIFEIIKNKKVKTIAKILDYSSPQKIMELYKMTGADQRDQIIRYQNQGVLLKVLNLMDVSSIEGYISNQKQSRQNSLILGLQRNLIPQLLERKGFDFTRELINKIKEEEAVKLLQALTPDFLFQMLSSYDRARTAMYIVKFNPKNMIQSFGLFNEAVKREILYEIEPKLSVPILNHVSDDFLFIFLNNLDMEDQIAYLEYTDPVKAAKIIEKWDLKYRKEILKKMPVEISQKCLSSLKLKKINEIIDDWHPKTAAKLMEFMAPAATNSLLFDWDEDKREKIINLLPSKNFAKLLESAMSDERRRLLKKKGDKDIAKILEEMQPVKAAETFELYLKTDRLHKILALISNEKAGKIIEKLNYDDIISIMEKISISGQIGYIQHIGPQCLSTLTGRVDEKTRLAYFSKLEDKLLSKAIPMIHTDISVPMLQKISGSKRTAILGATDITSAADILNLLPKKERISTILNLDIKTQAKVLPEMDLWKAKEIYDTWNMKKQTEIILNLPDLRAAEILMEMKIEDREEILNYLPDNKVVAVLNNFENKKLLETLERFDEDFRIHCYNNFKLKKLNSVLRTVPEENLSDLINKLNLNIIAQSFPLIDITESAKYFSLLVTKSQSKLIDTLKPNIAANIIANIDENLGRMLIKPKKVKQIASITKNLRTIKVPGLLKDFTPQKIAEIIYQMEMQNPLKLITKFYNIEYTIISAIKKIDAPLGEKLLNEYQKK